MFKIVTTHFWQTIGTLLRHRHARNILLLVLAILVTLTFSAGWPIVLAITAGLVGVIFSQFEMDWATHHEATTDTARVVHAEIERGISHYRRFQGHTILVGSSMLFVLMLFLVDWTCAIALLAGSLLSSLNAYLSIHLVEITHTRTAEAARQGSKAAFQVAFRGGASAGLLVAGIGLTGIALFLAYLLAFHVAAPLHALLGFALGSSLVSMVNRLSSAIFSVGSDIGTDQAAMALLETHGELPPPPLRSRLIIKNIKACAGIAGDLFETYAVTLIGAMLLSSTLLDMKITAVVYPLVLTGVALLASIIGAAGVNLSAIGQPLSALYRGLLISGVIAAILFYPVTRLMLGDTILVGQQIISTNNIFLAALTGLIQAGLLIRLSEYFSSQHHAPVRRMAEVSGNGLHSATLITGLSLTSMATIICLLSLSLSITIAYALAGLYGIAITATAMLSLSGLIIAIYIYGPIVGNAGRLAQMTAMPETIHQITVPLNAAGNTSRAIAKIYAVNAASYATFLLFMIYAGSLSDTDRLDLADPLILLGLLLGGLTPFFLTALVMNAISRAAAQIIRSSRKLYRSLRSADSADSHDIVINAVSSYVFREMARPASLPVLLPIMVGWLLGPAALGGFLVGVLLSGVLIGLFMTLGGISLSSARETNSMEDPLLTDASKLALVSFPSDCFKIAAGPAVNPLMKIVHLVALLMLPLLIV